MTLESLLKDEELTKIIKGLVRGSGRSYPPSSKDEAQDGVAVTQQQISGGKEKLPLAATQVNGVSETKSIAVV